MTDEKKELVRTLVAMYDALDDNQVKLILDFLTAYSVNLTEEGFGYVARIVTQLTEYIYSTRQKYNDAKSGGPDQS